MGDGHADGDHGGGRGTATDIEALLDAGRAFFQSGRLAEAAGALAAVLEIDPDHLDALTLLGVVAYQGKVFPLAVECLGKALTLGPPVPQALFGLAAALEKLGRQEEAALHYANALRVQPIFPEALAGLGLVLYRLGRREEGIDCLRDAVRQRPGNPETLSNLGLMLFETGEPDAAAEHYAAALRLNPALPEALTNLGSLLQARGQRDDALALQTAAVCLQPAFPAALFNLANSLIDAERPEDALTLFLRVQRLDPSFARGDWDAGLASALERLGRLEEAAQHYGDALRIRPVFPKALAGLGLTLYYMGRQDEGIDCLRDAVHQQPDDPMARNNLGLTLVEAGKLEEAEEHLVAALRLDPTLAGALVNLGSILMSRGQWDEAFTLQKTAASLQPASATALTNIGCNLMDGGRPEDALACFLRVRCLDPEFSGGEMNEAIARLQLGDLASGWAGYEGRWLVPDTPRERQSRGLMPGRTFRQPQWDGVSDIAGKRLLLWREQGVGDEVLFASCFPDLEGLGARITYEGSPKLRPLFTRSFPFMQIAVENAEADLTRDDFDVHLPIGSLPLLFRRTLADFPDRPGFLHPDPARVAHWRERLKALGPGPYVGLNWSGGARVQARGHLYSRVEDWEPVLRVPGLTFINMQYKDATEELAEARDALGVDIHSFADIDMWNDLDDVAALLKALDVQLAVPTAVHQLAGAVGVPTWLLLVRNLGWACLGTDRLPWYPGTRVATRERGQPWRTAIERIAADLAALVPSGAGQGA